MRRALIGLVLMIATAVGSAWLLDASIDKSEDQSMAPDGSRTVLMRGRS